MKNLIFIENTLKDFPLSSQDNLWREAIYSVVFCLGSDIRWYIFEGQREGDDILMFGIVSHNHPLSVFRRGMLENSVKTELAGLQTLV